MGQFGPRPLLVGDGGKGMPVLCFTEAPLRLWDVRRQPKQAEESLRAALYCTAVVLARRWILCRSVALSQD